MGEVKEGSGDGCKIPDEVAVEINEAYESLYVSPVLWGRPIMVKKAKETISLAQARDAVPGPNCMLKSL